MDLVISAREFVHTAMYNSTAICVQFVCFVTSGQKLLPDDVNRQGRMLLES